MHRVAGEASFSGNRSFPKALLMESHHRLIALVSPSASHLMQSLSARERRTFSCRSVYLFLLRLSLPQ
jgi:hypothetical protein